MASAAKSLVQYYNRHYQKHPILTISVTNALLAGVSDTLTQKYFSPSQPIKSTAAATSTQPQADPRATEQAGNDNVRNAADRVKQETQWTKDAVVTSSGQAMPGTEAAGKVKDQISAKEGEVKQSFENGKEAVKETIQTAADHAKTFAQQTSKEVQERGIEGAKDMVEGYGQAAKEMGRIATSQAQGMVQGIKDKVPSLAKSTAGKDATSMDSASDMVKMQDLSNDSLTAFAFDYPRLGRFMFYNLAIAPVIHTWYSYIDRTFPLNNAGSSSIGGTMRGVATQAVNAARNASQGPSLTHSNVPSHQGATPLPTTRNPTGMSPTQDMAKSAVNKATGAAAAAGSMAGAASHNTWLRSTLQPAMRRMLADQVLFAPVGLAMLFTGLTLLEGGGVKEVKEKLSESYPTALKTNYTIWPVVQLVNFSIMPLQFRLPFVSAVGIAWNAYLSLVNNRGRQAIVAKEEQERGRLQVTHT